MTDDNRLNESSPGPLAGLRVVEFASIGPGPYAAMLLADMGADVLRIDRPEENGWPNPVVDRGRANIRIDLSTAEGRAQAQDIATMADVVIEGLRPGVMERLGLGPEQLLARNPRLIYGRMTGWGQDGPLARTAGHDITYLAMTGALAAIGRPGEPAVAPLNMLGDFGGGSLFLVFGIMLALWERERSGQGQVVDAAILDGVTSMMSMFTGFVQTHLISLDRAENFLSGAAPYYRCYLCADGREVAVGAIEPQFWRILCQRLEAPAFVSQDRSAWTATTAWLEATFASRTAAHWTALFEGSDACVVPVLTLEEARRHPHNVARRSMTEVAGLLQPQAAPRLTRTPGRISEACSSEAMLARWRE
ncbi:carnitine dehydratase [Sphingobium lactosutens]|uniref:CaiB/BaiF CoA transferase family protein n=1 Tax=Sphingobium lactosutens TaxID=522773 RepID=UPI0015BA74BE|nr:CaiB/BaiF CoA-transferase family protein [Sphingobium lactosutens]NWK96285.1 carnitine dehydratase [Sphingobium lactosutens]